MEEAAIGSSISVVAMKLSYMEQYRKVASDTGELKPTVWFYYVDNAWPV